MCTLSIISSAVMPLLISIIPASIIPSHDIAQWIIGAIRDVFHSLGMKDSPVLEQVIYVIIIAIVAVVLGYIIRKAIIFITRKLIGMRTSAFAQDLLKQHVVTRCSHIIPPMVFLALLPFAFDKGSHTLDIIGRLIFSYLIVMFGVGITAIIDFIYSNYNRKANKDNHPLKGVKGVAKGILWIIIVILCAAVLINKSPMALLGGLGAFAAVLMLVFKDSILGFVAGIQLSSNDMLRVGDWIVVPSTIANGIVIDVSLTVVKVQNWDNTIIMLPPYTLVSTSFQNWRGMTESGVRQIDRQLIFDNATIVKASDDLITSITTKYPEMADYVAERRKLAQAGTPMVFNNGIAPVNGTIDTNLGLFRAYLCKYLLAHPAISNDHNIIVRLMPGDGDGTPLNIYCFTNTTHWLEFEAIRTQVLEHVIATAPDFQLRVFNATYHGEMIMTHVDKPAPIIPDSGLEGATKIS